VDEIGYGLIFAAIAVLFVAIFIVSHLIEKKRREAFVRLAEKLRLRYSPDQSPALAQRFEFLDALAQGSNRYAYNVLSGEYGGNAVTLFDYHYETTSTDSKGNRTTHHHHISYCICFLEQDFPELHVYPESFFSRIGQIFGFEDINFESEEFSRAFTVRSKDKKFAYDVCNARMMEYLLRHPKTTLEIEGKCLASGKNARLSVDEIEPLLEHICEIRRLLPNYLFQDRG